MGLPSVPSYFFLLICSSSSLFFDVGRSQTAPSPSPSSSPVTDPIEAAAVEAIFRRLEAPMKWNTTDDPCSGSAVDGTQFNDQKVNPLILCDCPDGDFCHVTQLKIYALSVSGSIPEELQNLTHLFNLNLDQNYLTGPLPPFIGNLTKMQYMTFGINALSGSIPKEIGNLENLISLGIGSNNFSGVLPSEFGNLNSLKELYMDSSGIGGEIPSTFAKLQNLKILWASDNNFTGQIPDFIGTLTNLTVLRLQGNSFQGPIPSSFVNLTKLTDLRIGDITSGSSSLNFIKDMKSLSKLILRNAKISDEIPSNNISDYTSLMILDLSFNNITGTLPPALFNSTTKLQYLFLGSNSISGDLPMQKNANLKAIDLSYNNLSGAFPDWVNDDDLQLNLVANNFNLTGSNSSTLPQGLECLQKDIPCSRGSPTWYNFSVNCGGTRSIKASDGLLYDKDNDQNVAAASYYVSSDKRWAVSNVGTFLDAPNGSYLEYSTSQFSNTLDTELFQSSRLSPSSLRYYGIGLENGNYTVRLQFVERAFPDDTNWKSVGRRVFDIYIQGELKEKDFDIRNEAGGKSNSAVERRITANVTENFLEIHFFWAGKGTCCIPTQGYYGPSISAISIQPNFEPTVANQPPGGTSSENGKTGLVVGLVLGLGAMLMLTLAAFLIWRRKRKSSDGQDEELLGLDIKSEIFGYEELRAATQDFNPLNKLGEGGFGAVFKGKLSDGREVAVKQLSVVSHHGKQQFVAEIGIITAVQHRNLVKLYGCCYEGNNRLLVYEYLENKSLDQTLFGESESRLDWPSRFSVCLGTARGLAYLHEESSDRIVHRDVKASNILLDGDLNPKISDFGLAKLFDDKKTHISTRIAGTIGYLAPEYALRGHLTEKADVFGFGVVALEIIGGRTNTDSSLSEEMMYLIEWAWHLYENNREMELIDPKLKLYEREEATRVIRVALLCTQTLPSLRPSMSKVVAMLAGDVPLSEITSKPTYLTALHFQGANTSSSYTSNAFSSDAPTGETKLDVSATHGPWGGQLVDSEVLLHSDSARECR